MKPLVKVCGITRLEDAIAASDLGAAFLGFVFAPSSPRCISAEKAGAIAAALRGYEKQKNDGAAVGARCAPAERRATRLVGVFVDQPAAEIRSIVDRVKLDLVQLHGAEPEEMSDELGVPVIKAIRVAGDAPDWSRYAAAEWLLLDTHRAGQHGGTGEAFDWSLVRRGGRRFFLAGGLRPSNVVEAIAAVAPDAVDVSSGVESSPGIKDHEKLTKFFEEIRACR
jgi:phosphoribosylanthranilate isomerase